MKPVTLADIEMAARALMLAAPQSRQCQMQKILSETQTAAHFRHRTRQPHPAFGTGTLLSCAMRRPTAPRPATLGADALQAYAVVIAALLADQQHHAS